MNTHPSLPVVQRQSINWKQVIGTIGLVCLVLLLEILFVAYLILVGLTIDRVG